MDRLLHPYVRQIAAISAIWAGIGLLHTHQPRRASAGGRVVGHISAAERAATFTFDSAIAPGDRDLILTAVAHASPDARALIADVDGLVDVHVGVPLDGRATGLTEQTGARYRVTLDLGTAYRVWGPQGIDRLVLHELGHVIDFALVPDGMKRELDAHIPTGYGCDEQVKGACANHYERFAESFAKWATGNIGANINGGYKVPPPDDLAGWGAPLAQLIKR